MQDIFYEFITKRGKRERKKTHRKSKKGDDFAVKR